MKTLSALFLSLFFLSNYCSISLAQTTVTIGGTEYQADTLSHFKVGPGSYYTAMHYYTSSVKLRTFFLEVDATNPYISFEAVHGKDSLITCEGISSMAQRKVKKVRYISEERMQTFLLLQEMSDIRFMEVSSKDRWDELLLRLHISPFLIKML